jgi:hypothetical protein
MKRFIVLCLGLFLSLFGAQAAEQTEVRIGAKVVAVTIPQGMVAKDRSKDLMPDFVKAHFKDFLRGTQMVAFPPAKEPDGPSSFAILVTDAQFSPPDIPQRIKLTLDFVADKKRLTAKALAANKALVAAGHPDVEPQEDLRRRTEGAIETVVKSQDDRHFIISLSGDGYTNYVATLACESRQVVLYSYGDKPSGEDRLAQLKSVVTEITGATVAVDPAYKAPRHMDTVRSASGSYQYEVPIAWVRRTEKGLTEPTVCFITHGSGGTTCNAIFLRERTVAGTSASALLNKQIARMNGENERPPEPSGPPRNGITAKGLAYAEASFISQAPGGAGELFQTMTIVSLGSDRYLGVIFSTNPPAREVFVRGYRELIESVTPLSK